LSPDEGALYEISSCDAFRLIALFKNSFAMLLSNFAIARSKKILKIDHFTPHDLRRTAASKMASEGVSRLVVSKILNHKDQGVTAVYDRHSYDLEKSRRLISGVKGYYR